MEGEKMIKLDEKVLAAALVFLSFLAFTGAVASAVDCNCGGICVNESGWWWDGGVFNASSGTPIQAAIDNATAGDIICVKDGMYNEDVWVNKRLTLRSENGSDTAIVNASGTGYDAIYVDVDYVNISGLSALGAGADCSGICLWGANYCNVSDNNVSDNALNGIYLISSSHYNTVTSNTVLNNSYYGIYLTSANNNTLTNNTLMNNTDHDFYSAKNSHNNTVEDLLLSSYPTTVSFTYDNGVKLKGVETAPSDPAGKTNINKYVNATNVTANSWLFLNVSYEDLGCVAEDSLRLWRHNGSAWANVTGTNGVNTVQNYVYANITEFSIFAPMGNGPTLTLGNVTNVTQDWGRNFTLNHSVTATNATAANVNVTYNVTWLTGNTTMGTLTKDETKWHNQSRSNGTVQNVTVRVNATTTSASATNATATFRINITKRDINVIAHPATPQTVDPDETFWINGSAADEYGDALFAKADLIREGSIENTMNIANGNANFSANESAAGTFNFSIRFYNMTHYTNASSANATVTVGGAAPNITDFAPLSPVNDTYCTDRTFNVSVNQTVNVTWYLNDTAQVPKNVSVTAANYTFHALYIGDNNVTAVTENANGTDRQEWVWNVTAAPAAGAPNITDFAPLSPVNDTYCTDRTFNVSVNQTVNVTWYLNDTAQVPKNESVTVANYTFHAQYVGENNVTAVAENPNGNDMQTWDWNVTEAPEPPIAVPDFSATGLVAGIGMLGIVLAVSVFRRRR